MTEPAAPGRVSRTLLLELVVAAGLVVIVDQTLRRVYGFRGPDVLILAVLYAWKGALAVAVRSRAAAIAGYGLGAAGAVAWPLAREWNNPHVTPVGLYLCVPLILLTLPTLSFVADLVWRPRPRVLIWRSLFEIGAVYPFWAYGAAYFSIFYLGGWWI